MKYILVILIIIASYFLVKFMISYFYNREERMENEKQAGSILECFKNDKVLFEQEYIDFNKMIEFEAKYKEKLRSLQQLKYPFKSNIKDAIRDNLSLFNDYANYIDMQNKRYVDSEIIAHDELFSNIDGKSLDRQQREAVVTDEINNLVIAGAGSGKTLTIAGKVKYLCECKHVDPKNILLLSFTKKSAEEMTNRIKEKLGISLEASTFHKLGLSIVTRAHKKRGDVYENVDEFLKDFFNDDSIKGNLDVMKSIIEYFAYYLEIPSNIEEFECLGDLYDHEKAADFETLKSKYSQDDYIKNVELNNKISKKTIVGEKVKSIEEVTIANFLFLNGIEYKYEELYPFKSDENKKPYRPDFYLPEYDIYIEHFGITKDNRCPWLSQVEEKKYISDMLFKRKLHKANKTKLIESYSYYNSQGCLLEKLKENLLENGVIFKEVKYEDVFNKVYTEKSDKYFQEFMKLCNSFISLYKSNGYSIEQIDTLTYKLEKYDNSYHITRFNVFKKIIYPIMLEYESFLQEHQMIDFADMINEAAECISDGSVKLPYKYIIIDEFQDISMGRYKLVKSIIEASNAKLMCVGDDWQSIYRFSGSDISLFTRFEKYFGYTKIMKIETTYRNSQELINVASNFILKNPIQIHKKLNSNKNNEFPVVLCSFQSCDIALDNAINNIINEYGIEKNIMIIGRTSYDEKLLITSNLFETIVGTTGEAIGLKRKNGKLIYKKNKNLSIEFLTVHKSKGLEADNVIIINFENSVLGFPNKIADDPILETVLSESDNYMYSEERRLFYVALTRTKNRTYVIVPPQSPSEFMKDLMNNPNVFIWTDTAKASEIKCPICVSGDLVKRTSDGREFVGCSNYPRCEFTNKNLSILTNPTRCEKCGGYLVPRKGVNGLFLGCSNYPVCTNTKDIEN